MQYCNIIAGRAKRAGIARWIRVRNGKWESTQFNSRLQPTQIALGTVQSGTDKLKLDFTYNTPGLNNNNGNVLSQTITVPTEVRNNITYNGFTANQAYVYDSLNRIKQATETVSGQSGNNWQQTFDYDRYGNRTFDELNTTTLPKNCVNGNQQAVVCANMVAQVNPSANTGNNRLNGYTFDNSGNTILDAQSRKFTYDGENKQVKVETVNGGGTVTATHGIYFYDGDGKRVKKIGYENNQIKEITIFVYDAGGKMVAEYSTLPNPTPQVSYLTSDHLGSPRINTDENGKVIARHDFQPFGEEIQRPSYGADDVRQKFTSYERDNETDLDFAQARMYANPLGRFTTTDPILMSRNRQFNPQEMNFYAYVKNNPLNYVDPFGEDVDYAGKKQRDKDRNKKYYDDYVHYVNSLSDDNPDKAGLLATIKQLEESSVTYVINFTTHIEEAGGEVEGRVSTDENGEKIMVNIRNLGNNNEDWSLISRFGHELTHAEQFDNGEIGFLKDSNTGKWFVTDGSNDSFDEVNAYRASVALGRTNGADNNNSKLKGIITGFQNANGDKNKELESYRRYKNLDDKNVIRQNKIVRFPDKSDGFQRFKSSSGNLVVACNRGCPKKND